MTAIPPAGIQRCSFRTNGAVTDAWTGQAGSPVFFVPLTTFPTEVTNFIPQSGQVPVAGFKFTGTAKWTDSSGTSHPYPDAAVKLQFLPVGTGSTWQQVAATTTATDGNFAFPRVWVPAKRPACRGLVAGRPARQRHILGI